MFSSVPTPPPTPSHAAVEESDDDDDEKALGSLGVKIDSVWAFTFQVDFCFNSVLFFMPLGKGGDYHGREGSFVKKWKANE